MPIIEANASPAISAVTQVNEGSTVNAIYLRVESMATNQWSGVSRVYLAVFKQVGGVGPFPDANAVGGNVLKKRVIHQEMIQLAGTLSGTDNFPRTLFNGVIKIPKSLRRFGYFDELHVLLQNGAGETTGIANHCVQTIYKEYQ